MERCPAQILQSYYVISLASSEKILQAFQTTWSLTWLRLPWASARLFTSLVTTTTPHGTGVRDYIHVCDLGSGHVAALKWMVGRTVEIFNLGTGSSVLDVIIFSKACAKRSLTYCFLVAQATLLTNYADRQKAADMLGWKAQYDPR